MIYLGELAAKLGKINIKIGHVWSGTHRDAMKISAIAIIGRSQLL